MEKKLYNSDGKFSLSESSENCFRKFAVLIVEIKFFFSISKQLCYGILLKMGIKMGACSIMARAAII